jgi:hypothetical protein
LDRIVETWVDALNSPCLRAEYVTWAGSGTHLSPTGKQPLPVDRFLRDFLGRYVAATPANAQCPAELAKILESLREGYALLPKSARDAMPIRIAAPTVKRYPGLPPVTSFRITVDKKVLNLPLADLSYSASSSVVRLEPSKVPVTFTLMAVSQTDVDWFAFGLDEKPLLEALTRVIHRKDKTLRTSTAIGPLLQTKPIAASIGRFDYSQFFTTLLGGDTESMRAFTDLLRIAVVTTHVRLTPRSGGSELEFSYRLSEETMRSLSTLLSWDLARLEDLAKQVKERLDSPSTQPDFKF